MAIGQGERHIDSAAVYLLDRMADIIGELEAVSFNLETAKDKLDYDRKIETHYSSSQVSMEGPDKMLFQRSGDEGKHSFWCNGELATFYIHNENNYVTLEVPGNLIEMIDDLNQRFDFHFPAADFFYPSFTDDILAEFDTLEYLGKMNIDGEECFYIRAYNEDTNFQLWISGNNWTLPKRYILHKKGGENVRFETTFKSWDLNPDLPDTTFEFLPPPKSRLINIMEKS